MIPTMVPSSRAQDPSRQKRKHIGTTVESGTILVGAKGGTLVVELGGGGGWDLAEVLVAALAVTKA